MHKQQMIDQLSAELRPASRPRGPITAAALWALASVAFVLWITLLTGELRAGWVGQLSSSTRFAAEMSVGLLVAIAGIAAALLRSVPGAPGSRGLRGAALGLLGLWLGLYLYGLGDPALPISMAGKRPHCFVETLAFGVPPLMLGLQLVGRRAALARARVGLLVGLAAGSLPASMMGLACMYEPAHILGYHLLAVGLFGGIGAALAHRWLPRL